MKTKFITLLMLFAFTISFAMPKDNLEIIKKDTYEKVISKKVCTDYVAIDAITFDVIDLNILQIAEVDRTNIQYKNNSKRFHIYGIQKSGFISGFTKSRFSENINTNTQNNHKATNSKIKTLYSKVIQEKWQYRSRMHLRGIQENYRVTKRGNYPITGDQYFKRKYVYLSSYGNTKMGNAINMDRRCLCLINLSQITKV